MGLCELAHWVRVCSVARPRQGSHLHSTATMHRLGTMELSVHELIAGNLKQILTESGVSQVELGVALHDHLPETAWESYTVSRMVNGKRQFTIEEVIALCRILDVPFGALLIVPRDDILQVAGVDYSEDRLLHVLQAHPIADAHFWWQLMLFREATQGLWWKGALTDELLSEAHDGGFISTVDPETGGVDTADIHWEGPSREVSDRAHQALHDLYREALGPAEYQAVVEDEEFWRRVGVRRGLWGTVASYDPLAEEVIRTVDKLKERAQ